MGKRRRRKKWKVIGHWSDPPQPEAPPPTEAEPFAWKDVSAEGWAHGGIFGARLLAFFVSPVLTPLIVSLNPDYLAGGFTLGVVLTGIGGVLMSIVRRRNAAALLSDTPAVTLMGHRLPLAFTASGLLTLAPCMFIAIDAGWVTWYVFGGFAALGVAAFVSVIRRQGVIAIDSFGIRFRDLWSNALPWNNVKDIRIEREPTIDWLVFDLMSPLPASTRPRSLFSVRTRMNAERTALFVHWEAYQAHADELAAYLQQRLANYRRWAAERDRIPHAVQVPDDSARALRDMDPALAEET